MIHWLYFGRPSHLLKSTLFVQLIKINGTGLSGKVAGSILFGQRKLGLSACAVVCTPSFPRVCPRMQWWLNVRMQVKCPGLSMLLLWWGSWLVDTRTFSLWFRPTHLYYLFKMCWRCPDTWSEIGICDSILGNMCLSFPTLIPLIHTD